MSVQGAVREEVRQLVEAVLGPLIQRLEALETQVGTAGRKPSTEPLPDDLPEPEADPVDREPAAKTAPRKRAPRQTAPKE